MKHLVPFSQTEFSRDDEPSFGTALREALSLIRRSAVLMLGLGILFATIALVLTQRMDRIYKSSAQIMIERPVTSPIEVDQPSQMRADNGYVDGQVLLLRADDTLLGVIDRAELLSEPSFQTQAPSLLRRAINWAKGFIPGQPATSAVGGDTGQRTALRVLKEALSVRREGDTNVVTISVRALKPELAQQITAALVDTYIDLRLDRREAEARRLSEWIDARSEELRAKLNEAERAVTAYRIVNDLVGDANTASVSDQQLTEISAELIRARADLAQKRASYERFEQIRGENGDLTSLSQVQNSTIVMSLRESLLSLKMREQEAEQIGLPGNARLTQIQRQIALTQEQLDAEVARVTEALLNEIQSLENRIRILTEALDQAGGRSGQQTQSTMGLNELQRVADAYRLRYERYLNNAGVANELSTFATSGTQVISSASLPTFPIYPLTKVFVVLSFLVGVAVALVLKLSREALSDEFTSTDQIERLTGVKVLSALPALTGNRVPRDMLRNEPYSPYSEAISVLRQNLGLRAPQDTAGSWAPVVLITSAGEDVGKTSVAASVAESAAASGQSVLLVDADLRFAGLSDLYDIDEGEGLCDILMGGEWHPEEEADTSGLSIVPAGDLNGRQPADCLASPALGRFVRSARQTYDLIVIDAPPVANLADCNILAEECSHVALVLDVQKSSRSDLRGTLKQLPADKISGFVLNHVDFENDAGQWRIGSSSASTYGSSAKLYDMRRAAEAKKGDAGNIGRIA